MRILVLLVTALLLLAVLAACNDQADGEPTIEPTKEPLPAAPTATEEATKIEAPTSEPTAYPPPPTPPGDGTGYPAPEPVPAYDPYPGGLASIVHPMGMQCEDAIFPDLTAAIGSLEEASIMVVAAEEIALNVCTACSCATSEHFRVQINAEDLDRALEMGWQRWYVQ